MRRISGRAETVDRHRDCDLLLTRYRGQEIGIARVVFGRTVERIDSSVRFFILKTKTIRLNLYFYFCGKVLKYSWNICTAF